MSGLTIPEHCGAMLLPDCVLFPQGAMPLNIFEPRYRKMLADAQESEPVFCIFNRTGDEDPSDYATCAENIGTIGLIRASKKGDDGTSEVFLHGFMRVEVIEWCYDRDYPSAKIRPLVPVEDDSPESQQLIKMIRTTLTKALSGADPDVALRAKETLQRAADAPSLFADVVAQQFIHVPSIRQALLNEPNAKARLDIIAQLVGTK